MLDQTDYKIIMMLRENGRSSNVQLARTLDLYESTVAKRVENLLANEIISIKAVPNPFKFGYKANAYITLDVDLSKVKNVCARLSINPNISTVVTCFGRYDVYLIANYPEWEMLNRFVKDELSQIDGINKIETFFIDKIIKRYEGIFDNDLPIEPVSLKDDIDNRLVEELMKNGRTNYADIAGKLGVSAATIFRRTSFLVKEGFIRIIAVPNPSKLGLRANANIALNVEPSKVDSICKKLSEYKSIYMVLTLMSGFEILAGVNFPYPEMLYEFIVEEVSRISGVTNIETFIRADIVKATYAHLDLNELSIFPNGSR
jgi:DNA-binding Lrp family transcriptional regulator